MLFLILMQCHIFPGHAIVVAHGRGCAPGQSPGPGSPPCMKQYHGSGSLYATPERGPLAMPMTHPSGRLFPPCTCPMPMFSVPRRDSEDGAKRVFDTAHLKHGEVEILTVDLRLANRVRCDNDTLADDVAKLMKVPVKRISVTPWSWALPDPPQANYLAFVQEDHERCDCGGADGHLQGYRKVKSATDGWRLMPDTTVMTVSQYQALHGTRGSAESAGSESSCDIESDGKAAKCSDGYKLIPISPEDCPADPTLPRCSAVAPGELCESDGECGTDADLDNCQSKDIYLKAARCPDPDDIVVSGVSANLNKRKLFAPYSRTDEVPGPMNAGRPTYRNEFGYYLYYWVSKSAWQIGENPSQSQGLLLSVEKNMARPVTEQSAWAEWDGSHWVSSHITVQAAKASPLVPSRVQMLTRDPCLVYLLREQTIIFKKKIAEFLDMPPNKVIVDPPPVKGTVGLLQLDTSVNSETEVRAVPMLGIRQCNLAQLGAMAQRLALLEDTSQADSNARPAAPAPAPAIIPAPAPAPAYSIANDTNSTSNATNHPISLVMKVLNIDYDLLAARWSLVNEFTLFSKDSIAASGHIPMDAVTIALYPGSPGSVVIEAKIKPPPDTDSDAVMVFLNDTVSSATVSRLTTIPALQKVKTGMLGCEILKLEIDVEQEAPQTNRPWIAFWSVTLKAGDRAQKAAWKLLKLVNHPGTGLSNLLPLTLARIPGLMYRSLQEPNGAIKNADETRLPPPEDKSVSFDLPNPYEEQSQLEAEENRRKIEEAAHASMMKAKLSRENKLADEVLGAALPLSRAIKGAEAQFVNASRAHTAALRTQYGAKPMDIVPWETLVEDPVLDGASPCDYNGHRSEFDDEESPYPWIYQDPPQSISLTQGSKKQPVKRKAFLHR